MPFFDLRVRYSRFRAWPPQPGFKVYETCLHLRKSNLAHRAFDSTGQLHISWRDCDSSRVNGAKVCFLKEICQERLGDFL